jgi:hypothetical protein
MIRRKKDEKKYSNLLPIENLDLGNFPLDNFLFELASEMVRSRIHLEIEGEIRSFIEKKFPKKGLDLKKEKVIKYLKAIGRAQNNFQEAITYLIRKDLYKFLVLILTLSKDMGEFLGQEGSADLLLPITISSLLLGFSRLEDKIKEIFIEAFAHFETLNGNTEFGELLEGKYGFNGGNVNAWMYANILNPLLFILEDKVKNEPAKKEDHELEDLCDLAKEEDYELEDLREPAKKEADVLEYLRNLARNGDQGFGDLCNVALISLALTEISKEKEILDYIRHLINITMGDSMSKKKKELLFNAICYQLNLILESKNTALNHDIETRIESLFNSMPFLDGIENKKVLLISKLKTKARQYQLQPEPFRDPDSEEELDNMKFLSWLLKELTPLSNINDQSHGSKKFNFSIFHQSKKKEDQKVLPAQLKTGLAEAQGYINKRVPIKNQSKNLCNGILNALNSFHEQLTNCDFSNKVLIDKITNAINLASKVCRQIEGKTHSLFYVSLQPESQQQSGSIIFH